MTKVRLTNNMFEDTKWVCLLWFFDLYAKNKKGEQSENGQ